MRPAAPVALLLACCAGCVRAPPAPDVSRVPAYRAPVAGCEAARAAARATLAAVRCEHDWDCVPYEQAWLGCDGWRDVRAPDPGVAGPLLSACAGVPSRALECPGHAGACLEGRCVGRPRPEASCAEATAALAARAAASPGACATDAGCETWTAGAARWAVGAGFERSAAPELHRVRAACPEEPTWVVAGSGIELPALRRDGGRCVDGRCAPGAWPPAETGPRFRDPECLRGELAHRLPALRLNALVRFVVDRYGWQGGFEFRGAPATLQARIADAVLACPMDAGTRDGEPVEMWVTLPLSLEASPTGDATGRAGVRRR